MEYAERLMFAGPAYTVFDGGTVLGCGGVALLWQGVAEAWMVLSESVDMLDARGRGLLGIQIIRGLRRSSLEFNLHRLQAVVAKDGDEANKAFLQWLGLEYEGDMHKYGPDGSDYERWAKWLS